MSSGKRLAFPLHVNFHGTETSSSTGAAFDIHDIKTGFGAAGAVKFTNKNGKSRYVL